MCRFESRHKYLGVKPSLDFLWVRAFQEQFDSFLEIGSRLLNGRALAGHVEFGTQGDIHIALFLHDGSITILGHTGIPSFLPIQGHQDKLNQKLRENILAACPEIS